LEAEQPWEQDRVGICTPPINTTYGQLFFYHGVERSGRGGRTYRLGCFFGEFASSGGGAMSGTIFRSRQPILSPELECERRSAWLEQLDVYAVFSCGAVPRRNKEICERDDEILLYYSGGDSRLCVATAKVSELTERVWGDA
jgi:predicted GH43/DUF377 family glycosyl hydrolase